MTSPASTDDEAAKSKNPVINGIRSVLRASIGAFALGRQDVEVIINRMIERGEITEGEGKKVLADLFDRPKQRVRQFNEKVGDMADERIVTTLNLLNVPTRSDLQTLSEKINQLADKVDELSRRVSS